MENRDSMRDILQRLAKSADGAKEREIPIWH